MKNHTINQILSECESWESAPINEILGFQGVKLNQRIKRIIVYGATQMGKTTMIMNLIGIKEEKKEELSKMLRGDAKQGNSSTSTPIIYNRWNSDKFGIALGNENAVTEGTLKEYSVGDFAKAIAEINSTQRHKSGRDFDIDSVRYYYIPYDFYQEDHSKNEIQILDLPGFGEKNAQMYDKVDALIQRLSSFSAGTIAVIRAEKIANLESEYKLFIDSHHVNHLAIAITHALSVDSEMKRQIISRTLHFANCKNAVDLADAITSYVYKKLVDDEYISDSKFSDNKSVFPLEKTSWIRSEFPNMPELGEAFDIIAQRLIERMDLMRNTTSIEACVEKLQVQEELYSKRVDDLRIIISDLEKKVSVNSEIFEKNKEKSREYDRLVRQINSEMKKLEEERSSIATQIMLIDKNTPSSLFNCLYKEALWHVDIKKLMNGFTSFFSENIKTKHLLCKGFDAKINEEVSRLNYSEVSKGRFQKNHIKEIDYLFWKLTTSLCGGNSLFKQECKEGILLEMLNSNANKKKEFLNKELFDVQRKKQIFDETQRIYQKNIAEDKKLILSHEQNIKYFMNQIENIGHSKDEVTAVFVKHFYKKKEEMLERMNAETDEEIKTALFIAYSAIYLNIKPYLEEIDE